MAVLTSCSVPIELRKSLPVQFLKTGLFLLCLPLTSSADQLRFDSARDWRQWQLPLGIVELTPDGSIEPVRIRKNINAALNAEDFGGGIRDVGSNQRDARLVIDGDPTTGWSPDPGDDPDDWYIEIDLGRAVSAYRVNLRFDSQAPPFELFDLFMSTGEHEINVIGNPIENSLIYRIRHRFKENRRHELTFELDDSEHTPIQFLRIGSLKHVPDARLVEVEVETIGDNLLVGLSEKGGGIDIVVDVERSGEAASLGNALSLIDGDLTTRFWQRNEPRATIDIHGHITLDLGAVYWVDLMRIIGGVVVRSGFGGGIWTSHYVSRRSFIFKFYEVLTSDGSLSPNGTRIWTKHFSAWPSDETRSRGMADHRFEPIQTRFVRIRWRVWDAACAFGIGGQAYTAQNCLVTGSTEELQVFGEGFPQKVSLHSPLIDLGDGKNLNAVKWQADTPPDTRVEIRTRTGNEVAEQFVFHDKNDKEVTEKKWEKLIPSFRGPIDTLITPGGDWSPWSKIYSVSGEAFQSPSPRRYLEMEVRLVTDALREAARLDWLALDFSPPIAARTVGEIYPLEAQAGTTTDFSYFLRPIQTQTAGFDRLSVETSAPVRFTGAVLDDETIEARAETTATGFQVTFSQPIHSNQLVELRFESSIFLQSTRFDVFLGDSHQDDAIRQRVDPGDASDAVESSTNVVRLPVSRNLFAHLQITPPVLTPNGDGINDELKVQLDLVNVLEPRPLCLRLFDLAGRLLYEQEQEAVAGQQQITWDGRSAGGERLSPGLYIVELHIAGDARKETARRLVSVAY